MARSLKLYKRHRRLSNFPGLFLKQRLSQLWINNNVTFDLQVGPCLKILFTTVAGIPELTPFCTQLTGITNETVSKAKTLPEVLAEFDSYCAKMFFAKSFCLLCDGKWDLAVMLRGECLRKGIQLAPYYTVYYDLKKEYIAMGRARGFTSLHAMLADFKLTHAGRAHSGIDDCLTIVSVVQCMARENHHFPVPTCVPNDYDPAKDMSLEDFNRNRARPSMAQPSVATPTKFLQLRGIPWTAKNDDISRFFEGYLCKDIKIPRDERNKPSGLAFVELDSAEEAARAAKVLNKQYIGQRYVEISFIENMPK